MSISSQAKLRLAPCVQQKRHCNVPVRIQTGFKACVSGQGPAPPVNEKERGAGDWQLYQSPAAVLKEVAARNAQARLPGPPARPQARSYAPQSCWSELKALERTFFGGLLALRFCADTEH